MAQLGLIFNIAHYMARVKEMTARNCTASQYTHTTHNISYYIFSESPE